ncbi:alpha/beta hydrolase fold domain-containing protein [Caviibacter abscessus]|uniref:alpha/beta hydrolase fold domain-containing protein n=1 Tax=Caviibacter abscessus TaxID=1766719 RepID=UPI000830A81B|nr:alpha/beta hydrolase [Caviibacter abscessus]
MKKILIIVLIGIIAIFYVYIHAIEKRSVTSFVIEKYFWISGAKKYFEPKNDSDVAKILKEAERISDKKYEKPKLKSRVDDILFSNMQVLIINDKNLKSQPTIFYVHGGSFINQPNKYHLKFLDGIAQKSNAKILLPIYTKAPKYTYIDTLKILLSFYEISYKDNFILMGDSAGGAISLSLLQILKEKEHKLPKKTILISPVVDLSLENKEIDAYEKKDPFLSKFLLKKIGELWSKSDVKNPLVSPIFGKYQGIEGITIITGTNDILYPDILKFHKKLKSEDVKHNFIVKEKMNHGYPLYPIPEAKKAQNLIVDEINGLLQTNKI